MSPEPDDEDPPAAEPDPTIPTIGGRKHRRKSTKKSRKHHRKTRRTHKTKRKHRKRKHVMMSRFLLIGTPLAFWA